jgi:hypothetical protein
MQPKRQYERFAVDFMDVHGKVLFKSDVKIVNISVGGISFRSDKRLTIGGTYILKLESKGKYLHLRGTIIWVNLNETTQKRKKTNLPYTVGMKFSHSSAARDKKIKQFIQANIKDLEKHEKFVLVKKNTRIHVRFLIHEPDKAMIHCDEEYKIKKISQGGMLIESNNTMQIEDVLPMEMTLADYEPIALWGRIVTCQVIQDIEPLRYDIGIEFIDMTEKGKNLLKSFTASLRK